jgi:hypothetical protein
LNKEEINILSPDQHISNTDFESLTKKELIKVGGDQLDGINPDEEEEPLVTTLRFGSEGGDTPDHRRCYPI